MDTKASHILVLGATGPTGQVFCSSALQQGHKLTIYARNLSKLPAAVAGHENVMAIEGELTDEAKLIEAVKSGPTVLVSFLGPTYGSKGTPVTDCMRMLFPQLTTNQYQRALILCTPSYVAHQDKGAWKWSAAKSLIKMIGGSAYTEFSGLGAFVAEWPVDGENALNWTIFRVPFLTNGEAKPVTASFTGSGLDGLFLSRSSMAEWVLKEMNKTDWVGRAPVLSDN